MAPPESKIVYVDNDPLVLAHARALLASSREGACDYLDADIRNPAAILDTAAGLLDFTQPMALMLMGIMGHFTDEEAYPIVSRLLAGLPVPHWRPDPDAEPVEIYSYCGVGRKP
jgi:hypothetical protein